MRPMAALLIAATLLGSWLGMQAVHEAGHFLAALLTGGRVSRVVLNPLAISRTDLAENPRPLAVVWAGPVVGAALPALAWALAARLRMPGAFVLRFFAGFCLVANGLYIGLGSFGHVGDCGEMLRHGSPPWSLWLFGAFAAPAGLWLWNGQGHHFGWGSVREPLDGRVVAGTVVACLAWLALGWFVGGK